MSPLERFFDFIWYDIINRPVEWMIYGARPAEPPPRLTLDDVRRCELEAWEELEP